MGVGNCDGKDERTMSYARCMTTLVVHQACEIKSLENSIHTYKTSVFHIYALCSLVCAHLCAICFRTYSGTFNCTFNSYQLNRDSFQNVVRDQLKRSLLAGFFRPKSQDLLGEHFFIRRLDKVNFFCVQKDDDWTSETSARNASFLNCMGRFVSNFACLCCLFLYSKGLIHSNLSYPSSG